MPRGRKKQENVSLEKQLEAVEKDIAAMEASIKELRQKRKEITAKIEEEKKETLYRAVLASGKSIDDILASITNDNEKSE